MGAKVPVLRRPALVSHVRSEPVPAGKSYDAFFAPAAAQIERMDACFGEFIHFLKRSKLYDNSVIIVTSDHGDSIGEMLRWGHSYTMSPEVSRIPLIVRVPERFRERFVVDARAVSLSTDVTPIRTQVDDIARAYRFAAEP